jgi:hypothetical protein
LSHPSEKYENQLGLFCPIYIYVICSKNAPNHQPGMFSESFSVFAQRPSPPSSCCCGLPKVLRTRRSWRQGTTTMAMACLHAQLPTNRTCSSIPMTFSWFFMIAMNKNDITYEPMNELNHLIAFKFKSYFPLISGLGLKLDTVYSFP